MGNPLLRSIGRTLIIISLTAVVLAGAVTTLISEGIPAVINYQGRLLDSSGNLQPDGLYTMTFHMYAEATGSKGVNAVWGPEEHQGVAVKNGYFSVVLGDSSNVPFSQGLFQTNPELYLGISVGEGDPPEMAPRQRIVSVPYTHHAHSSDDAAYAVTANDADTLDGYHAEDIPSILGLGVYDYGTSTSSFTTKNTEDLKICYGKVEFSADGSQAVTNLPFTSSASYSVTVSQERPSWSPNDPGITKDSGAQFTIYNGGGDNDVYWIAIGT